MSYDLGTFHSRLPLRWSPAQSSTLLEHILTSDRFSCYLRPKLRNKNKGEEITSFSDLDIPGTLLYDLGFGGLKPQTVNYDGDPILPIIEEHIRDMLFKLWKLTAQESRVENAPLNRTGRAATPKKVTLTPQGRNTSTKYPSAVAATPMPRSASMWREQSVQTQTRPGAEDGDENEEDEEYEDDQTGDPQPDYSSGNRATQNKLRNHGYSASASVEEEDNKYDIDVTVEQKG